jgi:hypothetical protein
MSTLKKLTSDLRYVYDDLKTIVPSAQESHCKEQLELTAIVMNESLSATEFAKQLKNRNHKELNETKVLYDAYGHMYETAEQLNGARQKQLENLYQTFEGLDVIFSHFL